MQQRFLFADLIRSANKNLCCIQLAFYFHILTTMHGQNHIKFLMTSLLKFVHVFLCMWLYLSILGTCTFTPYTMHLPSHQFLVRMCEAHHSCSAVARIWENSNLFESSGLERRKHTRLLAHQVQEKVSVQEKRKHTICFVLLYIFRI